MMRWRVLWISVCLVAATSSQLLTVDHLIVTSESPNVDGNTEGSVDRNKTLEYHDDDSISTAAASRRDLNSVAQSGDTSNSINALEYKTNGSRIREAHELKNNPSNNKTTESKSGKSKSGENNSVPNKSGENQLSSDNEKNSSDRSLIIESPNRAGSNSNPTEASEPNSSNNELSGTNSGDNEPNGSNSDDSEKRPVNTTLGIVKGFKWKNTEIFAYIDIPYGQVEAPFEAPHTAPPWKEDHEVKEHSKRCPQYQSNDDYVTDLNCLTLSIFTPANAENAGVLFYVHESSYHSGDPFIYGPEHLVSKGVILVLPNYRIGALGFLCLQNETAPGNAGMKDLTKALEWIKNNIDRFGGNSSNIVVGGDGDGGALAGFLAFSSGSKSYINRVITESGSMLSHLALDRNPINIARTLAKNIRNNYSDGVTYNNTFAEVSLETIVKAAKGMRFNPCIENNEEPFMNVTPWTLLQNKEIDITFMIGSASHAGAQEAVATSKAFIDQLNADFGLILPGDLLFKKRDERDENALKIKTQYFGNDTITGAQLKELSLWSTDASYLSPLIRSARSLVNAGATVYLYEFDFVGDLNQELISLEKPVDGAVRSDIIGYLFTRNGFIPEDSTPEKQMINLMVDLWVSFIKTGKPTAHSVQEWENLKSTNSSDEEFLRITSDPKPVRGLHEDRLKLWTELYNEYFIERSFALSQNPGYIVFITITFWIINTKFDYP